jgi:hypothetical protein
MSEATIPLLYIQIAYKARPMKKRIAQGNCTHTRIANKGSDIRFTVEKNQYISIHIKQENEI